MPHLSPLITPYLRTAPYLGIEDAIKLGTGGEATLQGDDIIAIAGLLSHHLLRRLKADALSQMRKLDSIHWSK